MKIITASELKEKISRGEKIVLIDARTPQEHAEFCIPGSINIPYDEIEMVKDMNLNKADLVVVYCRSGARSSVAVLEMEKMGYRNVYNLENGLVDWK